MPTSTFFKEEMISKKWKYYIIYTFEMNHFYFCKKIFKVQIINLEI